MRTLPLVSPKRVVPTGNRLAISSAATMSPGALIAFSFRRPKATALCRMSDCDHLSRTSTNAENKSFTVRQKWMVNSHKLQDPDKFTINNKMN